MFAGTHVQASMGAQTQANSISINGWLPSLVLLTATVSSAIIVSILQKRQLKFRKVHAAYMYVCVREKSALKKSIYCVSKFKDYTYSLDFFASSSCILIATMIRDSIMHSVRLPLCTSIYIAFCRINLKNNPECMPCWKWISLSFKGSILFFLIVTYRQHVTEQFWSIMWFFFYHCNGTLSGWQNGILLFLHFCLYFWSEYTIWRKSFLKDLNFKNLGSEKCEIPLKW